MTNAAERVLDAEAAANALVAELERLKTAAESLETAHADSERATQAARDVVTTLNDVMPAISRVLTQLQALDLPALAERLAGEITASGTALAQRLAGEIQAVTEPLNQVATRLETLPIEPAIRELDGKAASLQTSLARLEALPAEIAAVQVAQMRIEQTLAENSQAALAAIESLKHQIGERDEAQAQELRRLIASVKDMKEPLDKAAAKKGLVF